MLFSFVKLEVIMIIVSKLLLVILLWHILNVTRAKRILTLYKGWGVSTIKLFSLLFLMDLILSIPFLLVLKEFT